MIPVSVNVGQFTEYNTTFDLVAWTRWCRVTTILTKYLVTNWASILLISDMEQHLLGNDGCAIDRVNNYCSRIMNWAHEYGLEFRRPKVDVSEFDSLKRSTTV